MDENMEEGTVVSLPHLEQSMSVDSQFETPMDPSS